MSFNSGIYVEVSGQFHCLLADFQHLLAKWLSRLQTVVVKGKNSCSCTESNCNPANYWASRTADTQAFVNKNQIQND